MTAPLSPAAQAVLDAAEAGLDGYIELLPPTWKSSVAAAIRAIADQVVPSDSSEPRNYLPALLECQRIRAELLAIASELKSANG